MESRGKASGRAPQSAEPPCAHKRSGRGFKGETLSRGFPLFIFTLLRVRRFPRQKLPPPTASSTPFLCSCAKKRGGAPKKRAYGCRHGSCSVPPASPTDSKPQHHRRLRQADFAWPIYPPCTNQLDAPICPVGAYAQMGEAGGPTKVMWRLQSAFLWRLDTVSLGKHQRNGVESQDRLTKTSQRIGAHVQAKRKEGGTPGEGSPLDPLLRLNKHKGVPRSAERGQGLCPCTPPPLKRRAKLLFVWDHCFFLSLCLLPFSSTI